MKRLKLVGPNGKHEYDEAYKKWKGILIKQINTE